MVHGPKPHCMAAMQFGEDPPPPTPALKVELDQTKPTKELLPLSQPHLVA